MKIPRSILIGSLLLMSIQAGAQTSDSIIVNQLRKKGVRFSHNNSVVLLMNGQQKFDDLFKAIDHAKSSIQ